MFQLISDNWSTILVGAVVVGILFLILRKMYKDKKNHKTSCGCGCTSCPSANICHPTVEKEK